MISEIDSSRLAKRVDVSELEQAREDGATTGDAGTPERRNDGFR
ncbi:hypothetical protein Thivi_4462 [Thiocystis violascens DSM 198]|uniref:Uncharacterized protein n=1 Tax=Thiocystis violascens (strain ATCC 17096 / DSM 198 / 6111) TaxID=765911 RepID=I3YGZ1_THIV6|nr:hypothetical protein Thivi_4462 [Thiocystis violascens DSM 198]